MWIYLKLTILMKNKCKLRSVVLKCRWKKQFPTFSYLLSLPKSCIKGQLIESKVSKTLKPLFFVFFAKKPPFFSNLKLILSFHFGLFHFQSRFQGYSKPFLLIRDSLTLCLTASVLYFTPNYHLLCLKTVE